MISLRELRNEISTAQCQKSKYMVEIIAKVLEEIRATYGEIAEHETVTDLGLRFLGLPRKKESEFDAELECWDHGVYYESEEIAGICPGCYVELQDELHYKERDL